MAEEDIIYAKNRHFFGGIEPSDMLIFSAVSYNAYIRLNIKLPDATVVDGNTLCTVAGAVIRKSTSGYPMNEFDGDFVADVDDGVDYIIDSEVSKGVTYYYSAFPYSKQEVYNRNSANRSSATVAEYGYLYGFNIDMDDSNPATRVTYPADVQNTAHTPISSTDGVFDSGDWNIAMGNEFMPKPCMLTYDGTVDHYLDPNDYAKKIDGTSSSVADTSFNGNAMMEWPKIYTKRWEEDGIYHFRCSDTKIDDTWECWCNYNSNSVEIDHFYTAMYRESYPVKITSLNDENIAMRSIKGGVREQSGNGTDLSIGGKNLRARLNGGGWNIEIASDRLLIQDLLILLAKTTDLTPVYTSNTNVFGMEYLFDDAYYFPLLGLICDLSSQQYMDLPYTGSAYANYDLISGSTITGEAAGYIKDMVTTPYGRIPTSTDGSSTTYECSEFVMFNENNNAIACAYGPIGFHYYDSDDGKSFWDITAALSYKPVSA